VDAPDGGVFVDAWGGTAITFASSAAVSAAVAGGAAFRGAEVRPDFGFVLDRARFTGRSGGTAAGAGLRGTAAVCLFGTAFAGGRTGAGFGNALDFAADFAARPAVCVARRAPAEVWPDPAARPFARVVRVSAFGVRTASLRLRSAAVRAESAAFGLRPATFETFF